MGSGSTKPQRWYNLPGLMGIVGFLGIGIYGFMGVSELLFRWSDLNALFFGKRAVGTIVASVENNEQDCYMDLREAYWFNFVCLGQHYHYYVVIFTIEGSTTELTQEFLPKRIQLHQNFSRGGKVYLRISRDGKRVVVDEGAYGYLPIPTETPLKGVGIISAALMLMYFFSREFLQTSYSVLRYRRLKIVGVTADGTVEQLDTDNWFLAIPNQKKKVFHIKFAFRDAKDRRRTVIHKWVSGRMLEFIGDEFSGVGVAVPVLFDPKRPKIAVIDWDALQQSFHPSD